MTAVSPQTKVHPVTLGIEPSFGFGDRIGLATPGHVLAMQQAGRGILPIFPQQSIREMARTGRQPEGVMADAMNAAVGNAITSVTSVVASANPNVRESTGEKTVSVRS